MEEVSKHKAKDSCWFVIHGKVYDVTRFLEEHPGGDEVLLEAAGRDASNDFDDIGHSEDAMNMLIDYEIGVLKGASAQGSKKKSYSSAGGASPLATYGPVILLILIAAIIYMYAL